MSDLANIVRPTLPTSTSNTQRYVTSGQKSADPILVQIGRTGQGKVFNASQSEKTTFYVNAAETETKQEN